MQKISKESIIKHLETNFKNISPSLYPAIANILLPQCTEYTDLSSLCQKHVQPLHSIEPNRDWVQRLHGIFNINLTRNSLGAIIPKDYSPANPTAEQEKKPIDSLYHAFIKENLENRRAGREAIKQLLKEVKNPHSIYVNQVLSNYPFYFEDGDSISIPDTAENLHSYTVERIPLTPEWMGPPLIALGLKPTDSSLPPKLLFRATNYTPRCGVALSVIFNFNPCAPAGAYLFRQFGKDRVEHWLKANTSEDKKAELIGMSLGGCFALQTACMLPEYVSQVHAFSTPGLTNYEMQQWENHTTKKSLSDKPKVSIYFQTNDPVSDYAGELFHPDWSLTYLLHPETHESRHAHNASYSLSENCIAVKVDINYVHNVRRKQWPYYQNFLFIPIFFIGLILLPFLILNYLIIELLDPLKPGEGGSAKSSGANAVPIA